MALVKIATAAHSELLKILLDYCSLIVEHGVTKITKHGSDLASAFLFVCLNPFYKIIVSRVVCLTLATISLSFSRNLNSCTAFIFSILP